MRLRESIHRMRLKESLHKSNLLHAHGLKYPKSEIIKTTSTDSHGGNRCSYEIYQLFFRQRPTQLNLLLPREGMTVKKTAKTGGRNFSFFLYNRENIEDQWCTVYNSVDNRTTPLPFFNQILAMYAQPTRRAMHSYRQTRTLGETRNRKRRKIKTPSLSSNPRHS